jgi:hypothetical protein
MPTEIARVDLACWIMECPSALVNKLLWNAVVDQLQIMMFCELPVVYVSIAKI